MALEFMILDWFMPENDKAVRDIQKKYPHYKLQLESVEESEDESDAYTSFKATKYDIFMFGTTLKGKSVCAKVEGFSPYFFVKLPMDGKPDELEDIVTIIRNDLMEGKIWKTWNGQTTQKFIIPRFMLSALKYVKLVYRKDFWGFNNGKEFPFLKIKTTSLKLFQMLRNYFQTEKVKNGYKLYESNIDPFLRFIHKQDISPCGWVRLEPNTYDVIESDELSRCHHTIKVDASDIHPLDRNLIAPLLIASFDLECTSSHGDFPVAKKDYRKLAQDLVTLVQHSSLMPPMAEIETIITKVFKETFVVKNVTMNRIYSKTKLLIKKLQSSMPKLYAILEKARKEKPPADEEDDDEDGEIKPSSYKSPTEQELCEYLNKYLPAVEGDPIIQIGTTFHRYGSDEIIHKHIVSLNSCDEIEDADVVSVDNEADLLRVWKAMIEEMDPDMLTGYNIFGFDMKYIWERVLECGDEFEEEFSKGLGRLKNRRTTLLEQKLASAALGDNTMHYIDFDGIVSVDLLKVMQRDHKLDSYKLDFVAQVFLGDNKHDLKPNEIFAKFKGSSEDRCTIAKYCLQDCALCNRMMHKLKVLENNIGMGNVCSVPLSYLFMRGQGVKIFSLVSKECKKMNYLIPVLRNANVDNPEDEEGYEGAIVLPPQEGMYLEDPVTVLDYSSLYPSCMMERNLSHDCYVMDDRYRNLEDKGITYVTVEYDIYEGVGDKKHAVGKKQCTFAQLPNGKKGIIPNILQKLITQRKNTKKRIEYQTIITNDGKRISGLVKEKDDTWTVVDVEKGITTTVDKNEVKEIVDTYTSFEQAVLDALQIAYKVTANSLYGQIGSRTSAIYLKDIAACTTATGRERIYMAKNFVESSYGAKVIYGDTDSIFIIFPNLNEDGVPVKGKAALQMAIEAGQRASREIREILPPPQVLEYEKTMFPFILLSKKRYVGNLYETDANKKPKQKSMGIVLKRRDNAQIVKHVYGGIIDILLNEYNLENSVDFLTNKLKDLVAGNISIEDLIITKTLKSAYKDRTKIAHAVLADRMGERDEGNKPQSNDRIPYVYIVPPPEVVVKLQGDRIENPEFIRENNLIPDYRFYITNQIMKPICQLYALCVEKLPGYDYPDWYWTQVEEELYASNPVFITNEIKLKDKLTALKMKMVEEILFEPILSRLTAVKMGKKTTTTKQKYIKETILTKPTDLTFIFEFSVVENKEKKETISKWKWTDINGVTVLENNEVKPKEVKPKIRTTKIIKQLQCANKAFIALVENETLSDRIRTNGFIVRCDNTFAKIWKTSLDKGYDVLNKEIEKAVEEVDIGAVQDFAKNKLILALVEITNTLQVFF